MCLTAANALRRISDQLLQYLHSLWSLQFSDFPWNNISKIRASVHFNFLRGRDRRIYHLRTLDMQECLIIKLVKLRIFRKKTLYFYNATNSKCATQYKGAWLVAWTCNSAFACQNISYIPSVILKKIPLLSFGEIVLTSALNFQFFHVKHGAVVDRSPI